ncbi:uncharacterized protein LOC134824223 [Bolinopsis microptera]|uniref:uncharacterized protein LOC134824223 n=1 Tax=Bolinopsis microptera TaxID=2820187 RepID=UPI00307950D9
MIARGVASRSGALWDKGSQGHLVVYLSAKLTKDCQDDPIQAAACQVSPVHKRPIASYMNICPDHSIPEEDMSNVLLHHLLHVMGISQSLFDLGAAKLEDFGTRWGLIREDSYTVLDKQFVGTKSKEFVSKHFGCEKGYGVLMENQDSRKCHVEERLYRGEILTVNVTKSSQFTDLTFSILEDTGWYIAGKSKQPPFPGKLGCDVLDRSCNLWVSEQNSNHDNIYPFCGISSQSYTCNTEHTTVSQCQTKEHSVGVVPAKFQYHGLAGNGYRAGPYKYSDYCMLFSEHEDSYSCTDTPQPSGGRNFFLEKHGPSSVCVIHDGEWDINGSDRSKGAGCYSICCRDTNFDVIDVYNEPHSCYQPKQTIHVSSSNNNIRGSLQCPSWETACGGSGRTKCQSAGKCMTPSLSNGQVYSSQGMYQITIGTTLSYVCFDGFVMRGFPSSVCLGNNLFANPVPDCKLPCEDPFIEFGTVLNSAGTQRLVGDTVTFTCNTDYKLEGSSILTCRISSSGSERAGTWYPERPTCRKEYLEWSGWGPCSVTCGDNPGERIRTRGCSTCEDFEYEKEVCFVNSTCDDNSGATVPDSPAGANNTVILVAVFAVFFVFTIFIIVFIVWFFDKSQTQQRSQSQLFNESYYWSQQNVSGFKRRERSMDLSSEYSAASGSVKQLFTSPPSTPYTTDTQLSSKGSEESLFGSGKSFHIPRIHYKNRARVFPKKPVVHIPTPPSYQESLEMPTFSPDQNTGIAPDTITNATTNTITNSGIATDTITNEPPDLAKLRASIQAARVRVRNHPSVKRLFVPNPVTGGSYNPNQIPFEISEKEEENYLEDSWDFRQRQTGFKRHFGFAPSSDLKVEEEEDNKIDEVASQIETETVASQIETETDASQIETETVASQLETYLKVEEEDGGGIDKNMNEKSEN